MEFILAFYYDVVNICTCISDLYKMLTATRQVLWNVSVHYLVDNIRKILVGSSANQHKKACCLCIRQAL